MKRSSVQRAVLPKYTFIHGRDRFSAGLWLWGRVEPRDLTCPKIPNALPQLLPSSSGYGEENENESKFYCANEKRSKQSFIGGCCKMLRRGGID